MHPLILTNNPNLASTARVLQHWLAPDRQPRLDAAVATQRKGDLTAWLANAGVPHTVTPMPYPNKRWPVPGLWHAWRLASWARRQNVDLIHCNEHDVYPFALMLKRLLHVPVVCHARFRVSRQFCQWAFAQPARQPDALLWTTKQQQRDCAAAVEGIVPDERQHVVPLGVDLERVDRCTADAIALRKSWGFDSNSIVLGTACALRPIKQLEHFIDMVSTLARYRDDVVGVIAGDAPPGFERYRDELLGRITAARLGDRLRWLGNVEPIEPFMGALDLFVSTSRYETFGNSVCEAMACGTPVVGYAGGSVHEVVSDAGRIVQTGDVDALTHAVHALATNASLRRQLGEHGRQRVAAHFNPAQSLRTLLSIYASILEPGKQQRWAA